MAYWVYILKSASRERYYCGMTSNLEKRVAQHNDSERPGAFTTHRYPGPWELIWSQAVPSKSEALRYEKRIKQRGIQRFLGEQSSC